jgi:hypothetical protein
MDWEETIMVLHLCTESGQIQWEESKSFHNLMTTHVNGIPVSLNCIGYDENRPTQACDLFVGDLSWSSFSIRTLYEAARKRTGSAQVEDLRGPLVAALNELSTESQSSPDPDDSDPGPLEW